MFPLGSPSFLLCSFHFCSSHPPSQGKQALSSCSPHITDWKVAWTPAIVGRRCYVQVMLDNSIYCFYFVQTRPEVGQWKSSLTLMSVYAPEWICVHCSSLIKGIFKFNSPLCRFRTEAARCSIAPPGGHSLLCCYISISLSISFQFKRPVLFLFLSCDLVAHPISLSSFSHNPTLCLSLSGSLPLPPLALSLHLDDAGPCLLSGPIPPSVHRSFHLRACLQSLMLIAASLFSLCSHFPHFLLLPCSLCLSLSSFSSSTELKCEDWPRQFPIQTREIQHNFTFSCVGYKQRNVKHISRPLFLSLYVFHSSRLLLIHAVTAVMLCSHTETGQGPNRGTASKDLFKKSFWYSWFLTCFRDWWVGGGLWAGVI